MEDSNSSACRVAAFSWIQNQAVTQDGSLSRDSLSQGFEWNGEMVRLVGPQGIFKPAQIKHYPLSITTTTQGPYDDAFDPDGTLLRYRYRGTDPNFHENRRLRDAMRDRIPLIYFHSTIPGQYLAIWPAYIVGDDPASLTFTVAVDEEIRSAPVQGVEEDTIRRSYVTRAVRQRIHQRTFRDRVLRAYGTRCTICALRHGNLLDAAHIIPDSDLGGEPVVSNGLSLCKLHHAGYDKVYFGITPDYRVEVRPNILDESDGPILLHGLQKIHNKRLFVPKRKSERPDPERLEVRFQEFVKSCS